MVDTMTSMSNQIQRELNEKENDVRKLFQVLHPSSKKTKK